jgi:hypothetical protein
LLLALLRWRTPDHLVVLAVVQLTNLFFIASMKFIYNYHLLLLVVLMVPLVASLIERLAMKRTGRGLLIVLAVAAWMVNGFAALFRGKELDLAYQDLIIREVHARTNRDDTVWSGAAWAFRRDPAYRFWFLPELARVMVRQGFAEPYRLEKIVSDPPAAIVFDHNTLLWVVTVQRELGPYLVRHYLPLWRELWMPAMNVRLDSNRRNFTWIVPRSASWRVHVSSELADHVWFRDPLVIPTYKRDDASKFTVEVPEAAPSSEIHWFVDGRPVTTQGLLRLEKGQRLTAVNAGGMAVAIILTPSHDRQFFRQPPPGATLEGERTRVTHIPSIGYRIEP